MTSKDMAGTTIGVVATITASCGVIQDQADPLRTWNVFFWTPR